MRSIRISAKHASGALTLLRVQNVPGPRAAEIIRALEKALSVSPAVKSRRVARASKREAKAEQTREIRQAVMARAGGNCERCGLGLSELEMDHFFGRKNAPQNVRNCWALCRFCHHDKTTNRPDAALWLRAFYNHAHRLEFWSEANKARARLEAIELSQQSAQRNP